MTEDPTKPDGKSDFSATEEHRMLLQVRDALYDGVWDDFLADLRSRAQGQPHVFATIPNSPDMTETIARHIILIQEMQDWEHRHARPMRLPI